MTFKEYIKEIEKSIKELSNYPFFLSYADLELIKKWYRKKIPIELIKKIIYKELKNIAPYKRRNFSLRLVEKNLESNKYIYSKNFSLQERLKTESLEEEKQEEHNYPEDLSEKNNEIWQIIFNRYGLEYDNAKTEEELRIAVINYIWKNVLTTEEKKELEQEVISEIKRNFNINNIDIKKVAKKLIANRIKDRFNIP